MTAEVPGKPPAIVIATSTVMNGPVLRWYHDEFYADADDPCLSVSRSGVLVRGYLHHVPPAWIVDANTAFGALEHGNRELAERFVTHVRDPRTREIRPIDHEKGAVT